MESTKFSGEDHRQEGAAVTSDGTQLVVCVRSYGGESGSSAGNTTFGVLVSREVVAAPVDQGAEFHPSRVDVILTPLPLEWASEVERIPASRVDVVVPEGPVSGQAVAFVTLAQPTRHLPQVGTGWQQQMDEAIQDTGDLWSAVAQVGVGVTQVEQSPAQVLQRVGGLAATAALGPQAQLQVEVHRAGSVDVITQGFCDWVDIC